MQFKKDKSGWRWGSVLEFGRDPGMTALVLAGGQVQAMSTAESPGGPESFESKCSPAMLY